MFVRIFKVPNFDKFSVSSTILGANHQILSFYNFMNYADFGLGHGIQKRECTV